MRNKPREQRVLEKGRSLSIANFHRNNWKKMLIAACTDLVVGCSVSDEQSSYKFIQMKWNDLQPRNQAKRAARLKPTLKHLIRLVVQFARKAQLSRMLG